MTATQSAHFCVEDGFEHEDQARKGSRVMAVRLIESLKTRGYVSFMPAERPSSPDVIWDEFAGCRILVQYIAPGLPSQWADKFAVRVDTLASNYSGHHQ